MKRFAHRTVLLAAGGLVVGVLAGTGISAAVGAASTSSGPSYPVNESGQTYGSALDATSVANEPDLIAAIAANDRTGYVKKSDLEPPASLKTPEDNLAYSKKNLAGRTVPVYASDGKTVIGQFPIGGSTVESQTIK